MKDFKGKKIAVLGFGVEGESTVEFLLSQNANVTVVDERKIPVEKKSQVEELEKKGVVFQEKGIGSLSPFDIVVRSPGIKYSHPKLEEAREQGVVVTSATQLFFDLCPCEIIGVTGTKGKGTTSSLIYEMLKKQGFDAYLGGNIGLPPLTFLDSLTKDSWVVLELSSFQLQDLQSSPHIAVMLMVTSEHLDYHKDTEEYVDAKRGILKFQTPMDYAILNRDYPASNESDIYTEGKVYQVSRYQGVIEGCYVRDDKIVIKAMKRAEKEAAEETEMTPIFDIIETEVVNVKDILLPGRHNLENVCAAVMASYLAGVEVKNIAEVLKTFKGLEHRLELVALVNGVKYYDDSFSTTPETAIAAIEAFLQPEILILGGSSKGSDFSELGQVISSATNIKAIIGIGIEWEQIKKEIGVTKSEILMIEGAADMKAVVLAASKIATLGDVVLLSPACASFDMFKNYKHRGNEFKKEIFKLKENTSQ